MHAVCFCFALLELLVDTWKPLPSRHTISMAANTVAFDKNLHYEMSELLFIVSKMRANIYVAICPGVSCAQ